ncbi:response regulator [Streptomyces sp. NPDC057499]|uniref:response regulator n=1 Tax=Streptomyces sp. NPDC057499 TaxID=3346150 RepID=UPI0036778745
MVCEDDAAVRGVLKRALEYDGHTVSVAATADSLLRQLAPAPHLVVLDLGLPDADGRDVCLALRARGVDVPVLMLTALDGLHHKVGGFEAGADDYMTKPSHSAPRPATGPSSSPAGARVPQCCCRSASSRRSRRCGSSARTRCCPSGSPTS